MKNKSNNNIEILKDYELSIKNFNILDFEQAKTLYINLINSKSQEERTILRNKIIEGTLYVVYNFLSTSIFININSRYFDMSDVIGFTTLYYIKLIDNGYLIKNKNFNNLFNGTKYYSELKNELVGKNIPNQNLLLFAVEKYKKILLICYDYYKKYNKLIPYDNFKYSANNLNLCYEEDMADTYYLTNNMISYLLKNNIQINNKLVQRYIYILITIINEKIIIESDVPTYLEEEKLISKLYNEELINTISNVIDNKDKEIIGKTYELFGYEYEKIKPYHKLKMVLKKLSNSKEIYFKCRY